MKGKRDCYEVLGIRRDADAGAIKKAYRKLAKKYHPDTNKGDAGAEERFKEVTEAYGILSDPEKKKQYDQFGWAAFDESAAGYGNGFDGFAGGGFAGGGFGRGSYGPGNFGRGGYGPGDFGGRTYGQSGFGPGGYQEFHFESNGAGGGSRMDDIDDILRQMFGGGNGFSHNSGGQSSAYGFHQKGADAEAAITVSFEEAVTGCDKLIHLQGADGAVQSLNVHIPAGIDTGKSIRLKGKGNPGMGGGEPGDLFLHVTVESKPGFERKGDDVYTTAAIPFSTAVLGGEAVVQTLYGNVVCKIAPGTQSGTKIRLKGKGMPVMNGGGRKGDQYVSIQIQVPQNVTAEAAKKLKEFDAACKTSRRGAA